MRTNWRVTCLGLLLLGPLLTACGEEDDGTPTEAGATSSGAPASGVYGEPSDPDAGEPTEVATDSPAPAAPTSSAAAAPSPTATPVSPRLTYFGWNADIGAVEAGGLVPSIVEAGGRCTLTLTQGGAAVDVSSEAIDNVTSTSCAEMVIPGNRLAPGAWQAVLTYSSATSQGVSEAVEVQVP